MSFISQTESIFSDPLSQETRQARKGLIISSTIGFAVTLGLIRIDTINALGTKLSFEESFFPVLLLFVIGYFLSIFVIYAVSDRLVYRARIARTRLDQATFIYNSLASPKERVAACQRDLAQSAQENAARLAEDRSTKIAGIRNRIADIEKSLAELSDKGEWGSRFTMYASDYKILKQQAEALRQKLRGVQQQNESLVGQQEMLPGEVQSENIKMAFQLVQQAEDVSASLQTLQNSRISTLGVKSRIFLDFYFPVLVALLSLAFMVKMLVS